MPITRNGKLVGILTTGTCAEQDYTRPIGEVMTTKTWVTLPWAPPGSQEDPGAHRIESSPIVDEDYNLRGLITIKDIEKNTKYPNSARMPRPLLCPARRWGVTDVFSLERIEALIETKVDADLHRHGARSFPWACSIRWKPSASASGHPALCRATWLSLAPRTT